jgi:hypothetical protein
MNHSEALQLVLSGMLVGSAVVSHVLLMLRATKETVSPAGWLATLFLLFGAAEVSDRLGVFGHSVVVDAAIIPVVRASAFLIAPLIFAHVHWVFGGKSKVSHAAHLLPAVFAWAAFLFVETDGQQSSAISRLSWIVLCGQAVIYMMATAWILMRQ